MTFGEGSLGDIEIDLLGDASGMKKAFAAGVVAADEFGKALGRAGRAADEFGAKDVSANMRDFSAQVTGISVALGGMSAALAGIGAVAAKQASDFQQTGSLIERVFKDGAVDVELFAATASNDLGLSLQETREGLVRLGAQLKNSLGDTEAAQRQSAALVKLAADISAAQNVPFAETLDRIQSGLRGETEAIEKLNIFVSVAALKQEALSEGITKSVEKMTEQEKTQLRLNAIFKQSADVVGAAAGEAGTFAGQTARLSAGIKNLGVEFGQILLPVATQVVTALNGLIQAIRGMSAESKATVLKVAGVAAALGGVAAAAGGILAAAVALKTFASAAAAAGISISAVATTLATAAGAVAGLVVVYEAAGVVLEFLGVSAAPTAAKAFDAFTEAIAMAARGGRDLQRVLVNIATTALAVGATIVSALPFVDLTDDVDALNAKLQDAIDLDEQAEQAAAALEAILDPLDALSAASSEYTDEAERQRDILAAQETAAGGTAAALEFLKKKQKEAEKAAKEHTRELKQQAKALKDALKFTAELSREAEKASAGALDSIAGIANDRSKKRAEAFERTQSTQLGESGREAARSALADIDITFVQRLGDALLEVPTAQFSQGVMEAARAADEAGLSFQSVIDATPGLRERLDNSGKTPAERETDFANAAAFTDTLKGLNATVMISTSTFPEFTTALLDASNRQEDYAKKLNDGEITLGQYNALMAASTQLLDTQKFALLDAARATVEGADSGYAFVKTLEKVNQNLSVFGLELTDATYKINRGSTDADIATGIAGGLTGTGAGGGFGGAGAAVGAALGGAIDVASGGATMGLGTILGGILGSVVGDLLAEALGTLGSVTAPIAAALAEVFKGLRPAFLGLTMVMKALGMIIIALLPVFLPFVELIAQVAIVLAEVLMALEPFIAILALILGLMVRWIVVNPYVLRGLEQLAKWLAHLVEITVGIYNAFVDVHNALIDFARAILPGDDKFGKKVKRRDLGDLEGDLLADIEDAFGYDKKEALRAALASLEDGATDAGESLQGMTEELRNAPSDFKVEAFRFGAADFGGPESQNFNGVSGATMYIIENATIVADDPSEMAAKIEEESRRSQIRLRGSYTGRPVYSGRGEG